MSHWETLADQAHYDPVLLAQLLHVSLRQLERYFQARALGTPREWLNERRLWRAARRLAEGASRKSLAIELGFCDSAHLCRAFRADFGCASTEFLARQAAGQAGPESAEPLRVMLEASCSKAVDARPLLDNFPRATRRG